MVGWDMLKEAYATYLGGLQESSIVSAAGTTCLKSGLDNPSFNFFIVDNLNNSFQKNVFLNSFSCEGFVLSFPESHEFIETWSPSLKFLGKSLIMTALSNNIVNIKADKGIIVKDGADDSIINDHVFIVEEERAVKGYGRLIDSIKEKMYIYVAYINGDPAGTGSAIKVGNSVFILDTITREKYQNSGVLSAIGQHSMQKAQEDGIKRYSAIVTSGYSQRVAEEIGFKVEHVFDFWKNKVN